MSSPPDPAASLQPFFVVQAGEKLAPGKAVEVGNKAWNLMRMASAGLPVPPAFVLPTSWCALRPAPAVLEAALSAGIIRLERATGQRFGSNLKPLLVSVRSGAAVSMPGMMETVLDDEGDWLTLDGDEGLVYADRLETVVERPDGDLAVVRTWSATFPTAARTNSSPDASALRMPQSVP